MIYYRFQEKKFQFTVYSIFAYCNTIVAVEAAKKKNNNKNNNNQHPNNTDPRQNAVEVTLLTSIT